MEKQELKFLLDFSSPRVALHPLTGHSRIARNFDRISIDDEAQKEYLVCRQCKALLSIYLGSQSNLYRHLELHEKDYMQTTQATPNSGELVEDIPLRYRKTTISPKSKYRTKAKGQFVEDIPLRYLKCKISPKCKDSGNAKRNYVIKNRKMKRHSDRWHYKSLYLQK